MSQGIRFLFLFLAIWLSGCSSGTPTVKSIALNPENPDVIFISTMKGIYKSKDGGGTWEFRSEGLGGANVISIGMDPGAPSTLLAGTFGDAVYKTMDGGQHWYPANIGLKGHVSVVTAFAFSPKEPRVIFAATTIGPYRSDNGGDEWIEKVAGMESAYTTSIAFDAQKRDVVYAGTGGGVYRSDDLGEHWVFKHEGMIKVQKESAMSLGVNGILINPADPALIFVATTQGLFKSVNGSESWTRVGSEIGEGFMIGVVMDRMNGDIYAGTNTGIFKSTDGGQHWVSKTGGIKSPVVRAIAADPKHSGVLYAGTQEGLYKSVNGGEKWTLLQGYK